MADYTSKLIRDNIINSNINLKNNITSEEFRNLILSRNTYKFENEYNLKNLSPLNNIFSSSIESILIPIPLFRSINPTNSLISRAFANERSKLTDIATKMLAFQLSYNVISHVSQNYIPTIDVSSVLKGDKLFKMPIDYSITNNSQKTTVDTIISNLYFKTNFFSKEIDFRNIDKDDDKFLLENTGKVQLSFYYKSIEYNKYKPFDNKSINDFAEKYKINYNNLDIYLLDINNYKFIEDINNNSIPILYIDKIRKDKVYAPTKTNEIYNYVLENFEFNNTSNSIDIQNLKNNNYYNNINDSNNNKIIWGYTGIENDSSVSNYNKNVIGNYNDNNELNNTEFKVNNGLLKYTKYLVDKTGGQIINLTRQIFTENNNIVGFNGAPIWQSNNSDYANKNGFSGSTGIRQHTILKPYDRYAKSIRFIGNMAYGGNKNSVIHKSVIPKTHPIKNGNNIDQNLMFSIENLAVNVTKGNDYGIIPDSDIKIPLSEIGPFNCHMMWFPPYGIELSESSSARYDSTVLVGRNEPIYSYMNSERSATLSFILLVDYPIHLRKYINDDNYNKKIVEFFAFGGDKIPVFKENNDVKSNQNTNNQNNQSKTKEITFYFRNDEPNDSNINNIFNNMLNNNYQSDLNKSWIYGYSSNDNIYDVIKNDNDLDKTLMEYLSNMNNNKNELKFDIVGSASKLYNGNNPEKYNYDLGLRRANAIEYLLKRKIDKIININKFKINNNNIKYNTYSIGSKLSHDSTANKDNINSDASIQARIGRLIITYIDNNKDENNKTYNSDENNKTYNSDDLNKYYNHFFAEKDIKSNAISSNFESIRYNNYNPAFYSQTPEDFHRRLTFLQQCVRQGPAVRVNDNNRKSNYIFGRQPICILRIGDFFYTKVIIENLTIDYNETTWDLNPEGMGLQPMLAKVTLQMKLIGGQSLKGPISALQNAATLNYYANSTYYDNIYYESAHEFENKEYVK